MHADNLIMTSRFSAEKYFKQKRLSAENRMPENVRNHAGILQLNDFSGIDGFIAGKAQAQGFERVAVR